MADMENIDGAVRVQIKSDAIVTNTETVLTETVVGQIFGER